MGVGAGAMGIEMELFFFFFFLHQMNITLYMEQNNEEFCAPTLGLHWLKDLMFREGTELSQAHWENAAGMGINQKATGG